MGVWSTVFHDIEDPIGMFPLVSLLPEDLFAPCSLGPFWMQRELLVDEDE